MLNFKCTPYYQSSSSLLSELKALYPWPYAVAEWPLNSKYGVNNAADGIYKDGAASGYSVERGPNSMSLLAPRTVYQLFILCVVLVLIDMRIFVLIGASHSARPASNSNAYNIRLLK